MSLALPHPPHPHRRSGRGALSPFRRTLAAAVCAALVIGAGLLTAGPRAAAAGETTFTTALDTQVSTFNPFIAYFDGELTALGNIYPTLTRLDDKLVPEPYLATSWTTSDDKLTWTFKIKDGLKWSDGQPLTAKDAAWTLNLIMTNSTAAQANGSLVANFKSVTATDDTTLVITTKKPQANMLYVSVPFNGIPIVPQHIWESKVGNLKNFKNTAFPVVGYGPWVLTDYKTDQYVTLRANKDFFLGAPKYDQLILQYFKNTDASVAALRAGQVNQVGGVTSTQFDALKNDANIKTYQTVGNSWTAVEINSGAKTRTGKPIGTGNPILADPQVRLAILHAIDKAALVKNVLGGLGVAGAGYLPPAYPQFFWTPAADQQITFDAAKANSILDAAGYAKGSDGVRVDPKTKKPLEFRLGIHSDDTQDAQIAGYLKGWLADVGIKISTPAMSMTKLNDDLAKGDWDMLMDGWGTGPDPTYLLGIQTCATLPLDDGTGGNTDAFYCNPAYDKLFDQQVTEFDATKRADIIKQMQAILYPANADMILYYKNGLSAIRTDKTTNYVTGSADDKGFYPLQNGFSSFLDATPVAPKAAASHTGLYVIIGVVVLLILAGVVLLLVRRRSTAGERE